MGSGLYAGSRLGQIEAGAQVGYEQQDRAYTGLFGSNESRPGGDGFEKGSVGRRSAIIWGASVVWLVLVWRAVRGF
jgi:hypothetical protein